MLFAWLIKEKKFVLFGESDGAILNEYLSKPQLLSMQGDIYMGGVKGLLHINSKLPLTTSELPQLQLSNVITIHTFPCWSHTSRVISPNREVGIRVFVLVPG